MNSDTLGLIFAGVSALGALLSGIAAFKANGTKREMEITIGKLKKDIRSINDLVVLEPQLKQISTIAQKFGKLSSGVLPKTRGGKTEKDYYIELKAETSKVLELIPSDYDNIRNLLKDILDAFSSCINSDKLFKELDRDNIYSYAYVESRYQETSAELNRVIRNIKCLNVDE